MIYKQVTKNFLSLFLSNVIGQLLTFFAFAHLAKEFGPVGFGMFSFAQVVSLYFLFLADFGLQTLGTRSIARDGGAYQMYVSDITTLRILLAAVSFVLLVSVSFLIPTSGDVKILIGIFGLSLLPYAVLLEWFFQGIEKMEYVGIGRVVKGLSFAVLVLLFVHSSQQLYSAAAFYVAAFILSSSLLFCIYAMKFGISFRGIKVKTIKSLLSFATPLAAGSIIAQVIYNFGTLALGVFLTDRAVGLYSSAHRIVLFLWAFAVIAAANSMLPSMAKSSNASQEHLTESLWKYLRFFGLVAVPLGIGGSILASNMLAFIYTPEYQEATPVLQVSIWMIVIALYRIVFENALIVSHSQKSYLIGYAIAGGVTVVGNVVLIPVLGLIAPSATGVVAEAVLLGYFFATFKFTRPFRIMRGLAKPVIAGLVMGVVLMLFPMNLFWAILLGLFVYLSSLLLLRDSKMWEIVNYVTGIARGDVA